MPQLTDTPSAAAQAAGPSPPTAGILWVYRFSADGTAASVPVNEVDAALAQHSGWLWIHAGLADARCRLWLERSAPISAPAREVLLGPDEHLRLDMVQDEIVGVVTDIERDLTQPSESFGSLRFVMSDRLLITARRHALHSIELVHRAVEGGARYPTPVSLLDGIIGHFAESIGRLSEHLGNELDALEERVLRDDVSDERRRIARARLQIVRLRRQLAQMHSLFHRLELRVASEHKPLAAALRGLTQKLGALEHDVGSLQERSRLLQDEMAAKMTAITNRRLFTLSMLTACLLPPTLVTGFFGMNTKDLPFQQIDGGTWFAFAIAAAAGAFAYWALQRMRAL
jgi:zinc transporter